MGDSGKRRTILHVDAAVALHLISVGTRLAVEEVAVVNPVVIIVRIHRDGIVTKEHDAHVAHLYATGALEADTKTIERGIAADSLDGDVLHHPVAGVAALHLDEVAVFQSGILFVRDGSDDAHHERRLVPALAVGGQDVGKTRILCFCLPVTDIAGHGVHVLRRHIDDSRSVFDGSIEVIGTRHHSLGKGVALAQVGFDNERRRCRLRQGGTLRVHRPDRQRVAASLQSRHVGTVAIGIAAHQLLVSLLHGHALTTIIYFILGGTLHGLPGGIGCLQPSCCLREVDGRQACGCQQHRRRQHHCSLSHCV